jgi:MOSC domain-containing protein YiiM
MTESGLRVIALHVAPATRLPMRSVERVTVEAGRGIVGDRYHGTRHRHVTIQSVEALAEAATQYGAPIEAGQTRRNITVSTGGAEIAVPSKPGDRITVGAVEFEVVRIAAPCTLLDDEIGRGAKVALRRRAGSVCRALSSGEVSLGDSVVFHLRAASPPEFS